MGEENVKPVVVRKMAIISCDPKTRFCDSGNPQSSEFSPVSWVNQHPSVPENRIYKKE